MSFVKLTDLTSKEIVPGFTARFIHTDQVTIAYIDIVAGSVAPPHAHPHAQVSSVVSGKLEMTIDGETKILEPGMAGVMPPHAEHGARAITDCRVVDYFCPARDDLR